MKRVNYFFYLILLFGLLGTSLSQSAQQPPVQIFTHNPQQGSLIVGRILVEGELYYQQQPLLLTDTGEFVLGVGRNAPKQIQLVILNKGVKRRFPINIAHRQWKIEKIDGLAPNKVNPKTAETLARIKREGQQVALARANVSLQQAFMMQFVAPAKGRISGVFGSQRILNGEAKRPHFGLDIANIKGTLVKAPADGVVLLAEKDLFFSGGTIIIDHGYSVTTTYLHLSQISVTVGQEIKQGDKIGEIGATGRATGPHLDWRLNWKSVRLDPQLLLEQAKTQD